MLGMLPQEEAGQLGMRAVAQVCRSRRMTMIGILTRLFIVADDLVNS